MTMLYSKLHRTDTVWFTKAKPVLEKELERIGKKVNISNMIRLALMISADTLAGTGIPWEIQNE